MEAKELRDLSADDLAQKLVSLREEICHLKLKRATSRLENPMKLKAKPSETWRGSKPFCASERSGIRKAEHERSRD